MGPRILWLQQCGQEAKKIQAPSETGKGQEALHSPLESPE